jgi:hypothetical protein
LLAFRALAAIAKAQNCKPQAEASGCGNFHSRLAIPAPLSLRETAMQYGAAGGEIVVVKKVSPAELEGRKELLRRRGVPEAYLDNIAARRSNLTTMGASGLAALLATVGALWLALNVLFAHMQDAARHSAVADGAWFHRLALDNAMLWMLVLMLAAAVASGWLSSRLTERVKPKPLPNCAASALQAASSGISGRLTDWILRRSVAVAISRSRNTETFLLEVARRHTRLARNATLVLAIPSIIGFALTYRDHVTVGPDGIVRHSLLSTQQLAWREISRVELGCNHTEDGNSLIYKVHFGDWSLDLAYNDGNGFAPAKIEAGQVLLDIAKVDAALPQNTPRERWAWLNRDPMAPSCLAYWARAGGRDGVTRLEQILSVD